MNNDSDYEGNPSLFDDRLKLLANLVDDATDLVRYALNEMEYPSDVSAIFLINSFDKLSSDYHKLLEWKDKNGKS